MYWQGIHSFRLSEPTNEFHKNIGCYYISFILFAFITTSFIRIHNYWPDVDSIVKPCSVAFGGVQVVGMFICIGIQMKNIKILHLELQRMVDAGKREHSTDKKENYNICRYFLGIYAEEKNETFQIFWNTEQKCRKYTRKITSYFFINEAIFMGAPMYSIFSIIMGNRDATTWALPMDLSVPFDTSTILGWYLTWFFQFNISLCYVSCIITITTYFVCCCFYIGAVCEHYEFLYNNVCASLELYQNEKNSTERQNKRQRIMEKMGEVVATHAKIFE